MSPLMHSLVLRFSYILSGQMCVWEIQIHLQLDICCELLLYFTVYIIFLIQSDFISVFCVWFYINETVYN